MNSAPVYDSARFAGKGHSPATPAIDSDMGRRAKGIGDTHSDALQLAGRMRREHNVLRCTVAYGIRMHGEGAKTFANFPMQRATDS